MRPALVTVNPLQEDDVTASYTFDVFCTLDGYGATGGGGWDGYWGAAEAPSCSTTALPYYAADLRMVFGATTYRAFAEMAA